MNTRLEHANLHVRDIEATIEFIQTALPTFRLRHDEVPADGRRWVHVGDDHCYLALSQAGAPGAAPFVPYSGQPGLNRLGFEVDDVDALAARMTRAGYLNATVHNNHPYRKRVYFNDQDGNDWEFVQYYSDASAERNDYAIRDHEAP